MEDAFAAMVVVAFLDIMILNCLAVEESKASAVEENSSDSLVSSPKRLGVLKESKGDTAWSPDTAATADMGEIDEDENSIGTNSSATSLDDGEGEEDPIYTLLRRPKKSDHRKYSKNISTDTNAPRTVSWEDLFPCQSEDAEEPGDGERTRELRGEDAHQRRASAKHKGSPESRRKSGRVTFSESIDEIDKPSAEIIQRSDQQFEAAPKIRGENREQDRNQHADLDRFQDLLRIQNAMQNLASDYRDIQEISRQIEQLSKHENEKAAAIVIQRVFCRRRNAKSDLAATKIQVRCGMRFILHQFLETKLASRRLQRSYRTHVKMIQQQRAASTAMQRLYRGHAVRVDKEYRVQAATNIQSYYRMKSATREYYRLRKLNNLHHLASHVIQIAYRTHRENTKRRTAAATIQRLYRGYTTRLRNKRREIAVTKIQAQYRMRFILRQFLETKRASRILQRSYRTHKEKAERHDAATAIQRIHREHATRVVKERENLATTRIQAHFRRQLASREYHQLRKSYHDNRHAPRVIQLTYRAHRQKTKRNATATTVQRLYRGHVSRVHRERQELAATKVQAHYRMHSTARDYFRIHVAVLTIQRIFREQLWEREHSTTATAIQETYGKRADKACIVIQRAYWRHAAESATVTKAQKQYQFHSLVRTFIGFQCALFVIQRAYRGLSGVTKDRDAAIAIQRTYRGRVVRKRNEGRELAAIKIQAYCRMQWIAREYRRLRSAHRGYRHAATTIQRMYRGHFARIQGHEVLIARRASLAILRTCGRKSMKKHYAATVIQRAYRAHVLRRQLSARGTSSHFGLQACVESCLDFWFCSCP